MTLKSLEKALADKSISDKKFFKILLKYIHDQEIKASKVKKRLASINSPEFKKDEAETNRLGAQIENLRPDVMKMLQQYVLKQLKHRCGPKSKK
ncbi:MAG: hypothetical protein HYT98_00130 [Candidatus Sungbacteria bacterium]|nr:hypothetical protein [Candidatus Sungbacteria bacterium]